MGDGLYLRARFRIAKGLSRMDPNLGIMVFPFSPMTESQMTFKWAHAEHHQVVGCKLHIRTYAHRDAMVDLQIQS